MCVALKGKLEVCRRGPVIPNGLDHMELILSVSSRLKRVSGRATKASPYSKVGC
jgi:hypothetical protein